MRRGVRNRRWLPHSPCSLAAAEFRCGVVGPERWAIYRAVLAIPATWQLASDVLFSVLGLVVVRTTRDDARAHPFKRLIPFGTNMMERTGMPNTTVKGTLVRILDSARWVDLEWPTAKSI